MKIFITGGTGFVGSHLSKRLLDRGHHVTALGRSSSQDRIKHARFEYVGGNGAEPGPWQDRARECEIAFNLAGKSIFTLWTEKNKRQIRDSRILTTRNLVEALSPGSVLISTSAVGYYGDRGDELLYENLEPGDDFLAKVGKDWEGEAMNAARKGIRVATSRFGIVLGPDGGAMQMMIPAFKSFIGGPLGDGAQWFPWIHVEDVVGAFEHLMENGDLEGPFNFTAPEQVTNAQLTKTLGKALHRPTLFRTPGFMVRLLAGEFGETLMSSQRAVPEKLLRSGYEFEYPKLRDALENIAG